MDPTEPVSPEPAAGLRPVGRYMLTGSLGRGAMGAVYRAMDPLIERTVAIKVLSVELPASEQADFRDRFFREAKAAGRLNHPNIVTIYDVGESEGTPYIAMEYLPGRTLRETLDSGVVLPIRRAVEIAMLVARGLDYAHEQGIIHRDIKPANIMLSRNGLVKIMDFGIATASDSSRTHTGGLVGSPRYMAPEQITNEAVDGRTDIFALGVTLYEMLTGKDPFAGQTIPEVMHKILHAEPEAPSALNPDIPERLEQIVLKMLAKEPAQRFDHARELGLALGSLRRKLRSSAARSNPRQDAPLPAGMATQVVGRDALPKTSAGPIPTPGPSHHSGNRLSLLLAAAAFAVTVLVVMIVPDSRTPALVDPVPVGAPIAVETASAPSETFVGEPAEGGQVTLFDSDSDIVAEAASTESAPAPPASGPTAAPQPAQPTATAAAAAPQPAARPATITLSVLPWGEVHVGGRTHGVTPPLRELQLPPGRYRIEIRNTDFAPYVETVTLESGRTHRIQHRFR